MKVTLNQLKRIIEASLHEEDQEAEDQSIGTLEIEDQGVKAVLTHKEGDSFELEINGKKVTDATAASSVAAKAFLDLADYTAKNPEDKVYREKVTKFVEKVIDGGVEKLNSTSKHGLSVRWNSIVDKFKRGKEKIS